MPHLSAIEDDGTMILRTYDRVIAVCCTVTAPEERRLADLL
jgi:hypothetical protein